MTCFCLNVLLFCSFPPGSQPTSQPAATIVDRAVLEPRVASLVDALDDPVYRTREDARKKLEQLGDAALPLLARHLSNPNQEIASRIASIIHKPKDPRLCAELAFQLIATSDPDWMEMGVHMLFESPEEVAKPFTDRVTKSSGLVRQLCEPVVDELQQSAKRWEMFRKRERKLRKTNPAQADRELTMQTESNLYEAEVAYWQAHDLLLDELEGANPPDDHAPTASSTTTR